MERLIRHIVGLVLSNGPIYDLLVALNNYHLSNEMRLRGMPNYTLRQVLETFSCWVQFDLTNLQIISDTLRRHQASCLSQIVHGHLYNTDTSSRQAIVSADAAIIAQNGGNSKLAENLALDATISALQATMYAMYTKIDADRAHAYGADESESVSTADTISAKAFDAARIASAFIFGP